MSLPLVLLAAGFAASAAAFLPRIVHRLAVPAGTPPRPACAVCSRPFPDGFAGWVRAGPACHCTRGPGRLMAVAGVAGGVLAAALGPAPPLPVLLVAVVLGVLLAAIDRRCLRLPDPLVGALAVVVAGPLTVLGPGRFGAALAGAGLFGSAYAVLWFCSGGQVGLGDVKLAAVLGFALGFLGWPAVLAGLVAPHLINGPVALFLLLSGRARRGSAMPLGPALLAGALLAVTAT